MGEECSRQSVDDNDHYLEGMLAWGLKREGSKNDSGRRGRRVNSQGLFPDVVDGTLGKNVLNMEAI